MPLITHFTAQQVFIDGEEEPKDDLLKRIQDYLADSPKEEKIKNKKKRKTHYSGKRKRHTVKTQLTVNADGLIIHQTQHVKGSMHDYSLFKRSRPHLPDKVLGEGDLGYLGVKKDFPRLNFAVPFKKKNPGRGKRGVKAQDLPAEQKAFNKALAKERIVVEHTNSRVKKFQIWGGEFRNRLKHYDIATEIVSGIVNFRISGTLTV